MLRASVTIFYGIVFHAEGDDAPDLGPVWEPIANDEVHEAGEAAVSAGERLGATMPSVPYNSRDPKVYALASRRSGTPSCCSATSPIGAWSSGAWPSLRLFIRPSRSHHPWRLTLTIWSSIQDGTTRFGPSARRLGSHGASHSGISEPPTNEPLARPTPAPSLGWWSSWPDPASEIRHHASA